MPPPVAVPRDVPPTDRPTAEHPASGHPAADHSAAGHPAAVPDDRVPATSVAHVAALVRAAVPPLHPGGRPVIAGVAALAGLARLVTGRGALVGTLVTAVTAAFFRNPRRVPPAPPSLWCPRSCPRPSWTCPASRHRA